MKTRRLSCWSAKRIEGFAQLRTTHCLFLQPTPQRNEEEITDNHYSYRLNMQFQPLLSAAFTALLVITSCTYTDTEWQRVGETQTPVYSPVTPFFVKGIDLSFTPEIATTNTTYRQNGIALPILDLVKSNGINTVRLRLWHTPNSGHSNLPEVLAFARQLKVKGLRLWLDIHYSDTWTDPGQQAKPTAWQNTTGTALQDSVFNYTQRVMLALQAQKTLPYIVQIGNETNSGFLWNDGKVGGTFDTNWANYAALVNRGIAAVRTIDPNKNIKIMLHYANPNTANWFFQRVQQQAIDYDIIGVSYYPFWHGNDLATMQTSIANLAQTYQKPVIIAETAYPFTLQWNDWTNNVVGNASQVTATYPATPEGQRKFVADVRLKLAALGTQKAQGLCYWAGDWVAFRGTQATNGSTWENLALFNFGNDALPSLVELGR